MAKHNGKNVDKASGVEIELNELRSMLAGLHGEQAAKLKARLDALETRVLEEVLPSDPGEAARAAIMRALETAAAGKPGYIAISALEDKCNLTRSAVHYHVNELEKERKLWIRKTHDAKSGRPGFVAYHPAAVKA